MSIDTTWEIGLYGGGAIVPASTLGIEDFVRTRPTQSMGTVKFIAGGRQVDAAALFPYNQYVEIFQNGVRWFLGRVGLVPSSGNAGGQSQAHELQDPWCELSHRQFRQQWKFLGATVTLLSARLILGADINGLSITTDRVILEALNFAISAGAPFQVGALYTGSTIPLDEVLNVTCEEVIRKMLRWQPDVVHWFDFSTTPPTIHFQKRALLTTAALNLGARPLVAIGELTPRYDLQVPSVVITYEQKNTANGTVQTDLYTDTYPPGATGMEYNAVTPTIPVAGVSLTSVEQRVSTLGIQANPANPSASLAFLLAVDDWLAAQAADPSITQDGITITSVNRPVLADPNNQVPVNYANPTGPQQTETLNLSLNNVLVAGTVTDWMADSYGVVGQTQRIDYTVQLDSGDGSSGDTDLTTLNRSVTIKATNAGPGPGVGGDGTPIAAGYNTQLYTALTSFSQGPALSAGLAQAYWNAINPLQWSGRVTLEEAIVGLTVPAAVMGSVLNIVGSDNGAWASMNALIVSETMTASTGRTELELGPPKHLSVQDLVDRLINARPAGVGGRVMTGLETDNSASRTSGTSGGNTSVPLPIHTPVRGSTGGSNGNMLWCQIAVNGQIAYAQFAMSTPVATLPGGAVLANPD